MGAIRIPGSIVGTALALVMTACGAADPDTAESARERSAGASVSAGASDSGDKDEQITPGGIAVVVLEHLGRDAVQQFVTYGPEPGDVSVMIRLRDGSRDGNFAVSVYSPEASREFGKAGSCLPGRRGTKSQCRKLDNGTTVTTSEVSSGFSDDNADGMVIYGSAITPENGAAIAMYESYDDSPSVSVADLDSMLTDPRLTWLTDPALNEAGEAVAVKQSDGG